MQEKKNTLRTEGRSKEIKDTASRKRKVRREEKRRKDKKKNRRKPVWRMSLWFSSEM